MKNILIKGATIIDSASGWNRKQADIYILDNKISDIRPIDTSDNNQHNLAEKNVEIIDAKNLYISGGWMDARVNFCEPGLEYKETIYSGCKSSADGGFTAVACYPQTEPVVDNKSNVEFILNKNSEKNITIIPVGCISQNMEGKELAELYDMWNSGARAFADGNKYIADAGLMMRALQYSSVFGGLIISNANDNSLSKGGKMHEGEMSVSLGMKGIPPLAETVAVKRDLDILRYTGGRLHFSRISCAESLQLIAESKKEGLNVTCDVTIHHLILEDESLSEFNSNYKMIPPLRDAHHREALIKAVNSGIIDCIVSDHSPENIENKNVEFDFAKAGVTGTQILFSLYNEFLSTEILLEKFVDCIAKNPRKIFGLEEIKFEVGNIANFTLFNTDQTWEYNEKSNFSLSENSPFINRTMKGKAVITIH